MKIAIIGYGKMGKAIEQMALSFGHEVVLKISSSNRDEMTPENLCKADVAIEFSQPETAFSNIVTCLRAGVPVVSGTTAWLDKMDEAKAICEEVGGAFFYASNFSIGVNIFFELSRELAKVMERYHEYGVEMEEIHHTQKLDYPSGTAITLAEGILSEWTKEKEWFSVLSQDEKVDLEEKKGLKITSKRESGVPGTHVVNWSSEIDTIEIKHTAHTRKGFVRGALTAAKWLIGKKGVFGIKDMLSR